MEQLKEPSNLTKEPNNKTQPPLKCLSSDIEAIHNKWEWEYDPDEDIIHGPCAAARFRCY